MRVRTPHSFSRVPFPFHERLFLRIHNIFVIDVELSSNFYYLSSNFLVIPPTGSSTDEVPAGRFTHVVWVVGTETTCVC